MELFGFNPGDLLSYFLTLFRISIVLFLLPFFGGQSIPNPVKAALVLVLSMAVWPQLSFPGSMMPTGWNIVIMFIGEMILGMILGMLVNFLFAAVQLGGQIIGFQMGFAMVNVVDPINGHLYLIKAMGMSFEYVPPGSLLISPEIATNIFRFSNIMFTLAIKIAAPVMAALFLVDLAIALISRAAPQMHVLVLGFPIKITVGFFFLGFIFSIMAQYVGDFLGGLDALYRNVMSFGMAHTP
jgi:flagellar biosynthetic protein FliR